MANDPQNQPEHDEETAKAILRNYIFYERVFLERIYVPHRIPPDVASRYIREEVKQDARVEHINHACETARFYRLRDCLDHFAEFLNRNTDDVGDAYRSAESIDVLGDLGDEDQQKVAHDHWEKLTAHRRLDKVGERLAASFFHLAPGVSADPLSKELDKQQKEAAKNDDEDNPKPGDPDPRRPGRRAARGLSAGRLRQAPKGHGPGHDPGGPAGTRPGPHLPRHGRFRSTGAGLGRLRTKGRSDRAIE